MEEQAFTFLPQTGEEQWWFWGGAVLALAAGTSTFFLLRRSWNHKASAGKTLPAMLLFFLALSGLGSAIFSGVQLLRLQPLKIDSAGLHLKKVRVPWEDIAEVRVQTTQDRNALNMASTDTRILIIRTTGGRYFFFSGKNYPLPEMLGRMQEFQKRD